MRDNEEQQVEKDWREMDRANALFSREYDDELLHFTLQQIAEWEQALECVDDPQEALVNREWNKLSGIFATATFHK